MMGTKRNVTLIKTREEDKAQCYKFGSDLNDVIWLCGSDRAQQASLGDRGDLVYSSGGSRGRWTFHAYDKSTGKDDQSR